MKPNSMRASAGEHTTSVIDACNTIAIDVGHFCTGAYRGVADSEAVLVGSLEVNVVVHKGCPIRTALVAQSVTVKFDRLTYALQATDVIL